MEIAGWRGIEHGRVVPRAIGPAKIAPADDPIVRGAARFSINDEIDERPCLEPGVRVLASAPERGEAPVFWVQERDGSRDERRHRVERSAAQACRALPLGRRRRAQPSVQVMSRA